MPRLAGTSIPKYRKHRPSAQAVVTIGGVDHYLGPHGTKASKLEYDRLIAPMDGERSTTSRHRRRRVACRGTNQTLPRARSAALRQERQADQRTARHCLRVAIRAGALPRRTGNRFWTAGVESRAAQDGRSRLRLALALKIDLAMRENAPAGWKGDDTREKQVLNASVPAHVARSGGHAGALRDYQEPAGVLMTETINVGELSIRITKKNIKNVHLSVHPPSGRVSLVTPTATRSDVALRLCDQQTRLDT